jgi:hypothetical protein
MKSQDHVCRALEEDAKRQKSVAAASSALAPRPILIVPPYAEPRANVIRAA